LLACSDKACAEKVCCKPRRSSTLTSVISRPPSPATDNQKQLESREEAPPIDDRVVSPSFVAVNLQVDDEKKREQEV